MRMIRTISALAVCGVLGSGVAWGQEYEEAPLEDPRTEEQRQADAEAEAAAQAELEAMAAGWGHEESPVEALEEESGLEENTFSAESFGGKHLLPIKVRDCWYFVSSESPWRGNPYVLTVRRLQTPRCEAKTVRFWEARSYRQGSLQVSAKGDSLVIAYQVSESPWGTQPPSHLRIYNLPVETLQNVRTVHQKLESWGYRVDATHLSFDGHRLILRGTTRGPLKDLPTSGYQGQYYTLTFDRFLDKDAPPSVEYSSEPPSEPITTPEEISTTYTPYIEGRTVPPFQVNNCWYFVSATYAGRWGPLSLRIERLPVSGCEGKITYLGRSYSEGPILVATKGRNAIAIAQMVKHAPPFVTSPIYVRVYEISPETLQNERLFNNQLGTPGGRVTARRMYFSGHSLVVEGTKTGPIATWPPESGSGSNYTATFEHFLRSYQPPSVVAW